jgi:hypothetical protein
MLNSAYAGARGLDGNLHFPVPSLNRLNQTSLQTFTIFSCWAFLGILFLTISLSHPCYLCRVAAVKSFPVHLINDVIFSILEDRSARQYCCVYILDDILVSCIWPFSIWVVPVFLLEYCIITLRIRCLLFKLVFWRVCDMRACIFKKFKKSPFSCWILLKPVLWGVGGNLHFPELSMSRLNQTEQHFTILSCWAFLRILFFTILLFKFLSE